MIGTGMGEMEISSMWKYVIVLLVPVATYATGYYVGKGRTPAPQVVTVEKVVEVKGEERVVYRDRVVYREVEKVTRPDGTVTEKSREKETTGEKAAETTHSTVEASKAAEVSPPVQTSTNYSVGISGRLDYRDLGHVTPEVTVGRRLLGDIWLGIGLTSEDAALGLEVQW